MGNLGYCIFFTKWEQYIYTEIYCMYTYVCAYWHMSSLHELGPTSLPQMTKNIITGSEGQDEEQIQERKK